MGREIERNVITETPVRMNGYIACSSTGDKLGATDLDVIRVGMMAVATVKTVLKDPRYVRNMGDSKNESFFGVEIAHLLV